MKKQMKRGAFSPCLKCRMDLYNSPEIQQLRHDDTPPQRRRNDMYSYIRHDWVSAEEFNKEAELTIYRQLQEKEAI